MIQCILFDFFGTLVDYDENRSAQSYAETYEFLSDAAIGTDSGAAMSYGAFMSATDAAFTQLTTQSQLTLIEFSMIEAMGRVADELGIPLDNPTLIELATRYTLEWSKGVVPIPGIKRFLTSLQHKYRLGLISNTHFRPMVDRLLDEMEISNLFEVVVTSDVHGCLKPHPRIFNDTLDQLNIPAKDAVYVGDNYRADYLGATQVGLSCYLIGKNARIPAEYQLPTVLDLPVHLFHQV